MSNWKVLEKMAEENTPDGIGLCPDIVEYKLSGNKGKVTIGVPPQVITGLIKGTHNVKLLVIKVADFERIKKAMQSDIVRGKSVENG